MIASAAALLPAYGIRGTSFARVIEHSGAPRGSVGHHFPGGKDEMIIAAIAVAGNRVTGQLHGLIESGATFIQAVESVCDYFSQGLMRSDFRAGCPIAAAATDEDLSDEARSVAIGIVDDWISLLAGSAAAEGLDAEQARLRAETALHSIEGALILCKLRRSADPLQSALNGIKSFTFS
ncbi:TetR/AcrR family transcriptional regulator [Gordonia sp. VNK21]|uniref:TetR/AcrR family transcriptional regulator n=1 Tax=Gordonia sp. VNK21 TaxID=3382483 RepID=UPI0038D46CA3